MKLPLGKWLVESIRDWRMWRLTCYQQALRLQRLAPLAASGSLIHPSLEFKGRPWTNEMFEVAPGCEIEESVAIWFSEDESVAAQLKLGKRVFIGRGTFLGVHHPLTFGDNTIVGAYSYIISANHSTATRKIPIRDQGFTGASIQIGEDVWIGTHVVILPGVSIGKGAVIAAGSIVNRNVPEYEIWGGVPAKFLKTRHE
jgi:acetyltransferase-like isoleucine patch superfamily enzyme